MSLKMIVNTAVGAFIFFYCSINFAYDCQGIKKQPMRNGGPGEYFEIKTAGHHCLESDVTSVGEPFAWIDGGQRSSNGSVGYIDTSNVKINLQGRSIKAKDLGAGGISDRGSDGNVTSITITNGNIESKSGYGVKFWNSIRWDAATPKHDFFYVSKRSPHYYPMDERTYQEFLDYIHNLKTNFPRTTHKFELVTIKSKKQAIIIRGAGNFIKNSHFQITGFESALDLSGPDQIIEGNTIVISAGGKSSAPIVLKMADRSVIRNNTIIIEGFGDKPEAAISLMDSKNVRIENNKIIGINKLYEIHEQRADQKSSVIEGQGERANEFISGWRRFFMK